MNVIDGVGGIGTDCDTLRVTVWLSDGESENVCVLERVRVNVGAGVMVVETVGVSGSGTDFETDVDKVCVTERVRVVLSLALSVRSSVKEELIDEVGVGVGGLDGVVEFVCVGVGSLVIVFRSGGQMIE